MIVLRSVLICLLVLLTAPGLLAETQPMLSYELQVFRLDGAFRTKTSLSPKIWEADKEILSKIEGSVTLFDQGEFEWGKDQLKLAHKGCFWNGKKLTFEEGIRAQLPDGKVKMIYSPTVQKPAGELVRLKIESDTPFQYMERQDDGSFELKEVNLPVGMNLEVRTKQNRAGGIRVDYLEIELRSIGSREQVPGVSLPIGKPKLREWEYNFGFNPSPRKGYGILVRPEGTTGAMLIRLAVTESKLLERLNREKKD